MIEMSPASQQGCNCSNTEGNPRCTESLAECHMQTVSWPLFDHDSWHRLTLNSFIAVMCLERSCEAYYLSVRNPKGDNTNWNKSKLVNIILCYYNTHVVTLSHDYALDLFCYDRFGDFSLPMLIFWAEHQKIRIIKRKRKKHQTLNVKRSCLHFQNPSSLIPSPKV